MNPLNRSLLSIAMAALLVSPASFAFQSPLSDESVREAYFLGQRHDASFLTNYIKFLPPPKAGPYISSITFLTPFAQFAQFSTNYVGNYSAQQALRRDLSHQFLWRSDRQPCRFTTPFLCSHTAPL
jgi:hypothetical protein